MENILVVWTEDQTSYNIPLFQRPIQSKEGPNSLQFYIGWKRWGSQKKSLKLAEIGSWGLRKESVSITHKCKVKQQVLMLNLHQVIQKI